MGVILHMSLATQLDLIMSLATLLDLILPLMLRYLVCQKVETQTCSEGLLFSWKSDFGSPVGLVEKSYLAVFEDSKGLSKRLPDMFKYRSVCNGPKEKIIQVSFFRNSETFVAKHRENLFLAAHIRK